MTEESWGEYPTSQPQVPPSPTPYDSGEPGGQVPYDPAQYGPGAPGGQSPGAGPGSAYPEYGYPGYGYPQVPAYPAYGPSSMSPQDERMWAVFAHIGGLLVPFAWLIIYLVYKDRSQFVRAHAAEAVNFHLSLIIYQLGGFVVSIVLALVTLGIGFLLVIPLYLALVVFALVVVIMAAIAANQGRPYRYPITIRMVN